MPTTDFQKGTTITKEWLNEADDHIFDQTSSKHSADHITNTPAGNLVATNVQAALNELDTEKAKAGINTDITSLASDLVLAASPAVGDNSLKVPTTGWVQSELTYNREGALLGNVGLTASVAANALTISLTTADGSTPSNTNPVRLGFRHQTATIGRQEIVQVTGATSITIPSGATLGCLSGQYHRIWIGALNYGGTVELFVFNTYGYSLSLSTNGILPPRSYISTTLGSKFYSTVALDATSDISGAPYSTNARTNVPWIILGCLDITEATAGTWASAPILLQVDPPFRFGDVASCVFGSTGAVATTTNSIADDDLVSCSTADTTPFPSVTLPEHGFGYPNLVLIEGYANVAVSSAAHVYLCCAENGGLATPHGISREYLATAGQIYGIQVAGIARKNTNSTFSEVLGIGTSAGTLTINGIAGARKKGGSLLSWLRVTEIYA